MKITPNSMYNPYTNKSTVKTAASGQETKKINKNFDEVFISTENQVSSNENFVKDLSAKISQEIRTSTPASELEELSNRIDAGNYEIDQNQLVKKMILE